MPSYKLMMKNISKVFDMYYKRALSNKSINKPISWALYWTWKWANQQEVDRNASKES
jgi:hypothetical protein